MCLIINKQELQEGLNYISELDCWIFRDAETETFNLIENRCRHESGRFVKDKICSQYLFCPKHGWMLDAMTQTYVNPSELSHLNRVFRIDVTSDSVIIGTKNKSGLQSNNRNNKLPPLFKGEITLTFLNHACCVVQANGVSITTDPWILGPAFCTGWFLQKPTPKHAIEVILKSQYLYISHSHPDHLNPYSLIYLKNIGWNPTVILPQFEKRDISKLILERLGYNKIQTLQSQHSINLSESLQAKVFTDISGRNDSALEINYKGLTLLNLVDTSNPDLPDNYHADIVLAPFAGGASGFPVCWTDMYGYQKVEEIVLKNRQNSLKNFVEKSKNYSANLVIPFAGYFATPLDCDESIDSINVKNTAEEVSKVARRSLPSVKFWVPFPGENIDLSEIYYVSGTNDEEINNKNLTSEAQCANSLEDFFKAPGDYLDFLYTMYNNFSKNEVVEFFSRQAYRSNLVLKIESYDLNFVECYWQCTWNFASNEPIDDSDNLEQHHTNAIKFLRVKVRNFAIGMTIRNSLPWEEFSIGFQARFFRDPDIYNFDFWDYFQNSFIPTCEPYSDLLQNLQARFKE